jgi:signal peptidase I
MVGAVDPVTPRPDAPASPGADPTAAEGAVPADGLPGDAPADARLVPDVGTRRRRRRRSGTRTAIEWTLLVVGAVALALLLRANVVQAFYIPSDSMVPTLQQGDRVLVNKLSYKLHDVHRGDIVVFEAPPGEATGDIKDLVKRVVGLPGETIEGRDGRIYIDGDLLEEGYLPDGTVSKEFDPVDVPAGTFFMLGDNRRASKDSTFFGPIRESTIIGRVFVRIWPPNRLDIL